MSKIYLENYPDQALSQPSITGNLWSLIQPMKNGNFLSLLLFGSTHLLVFFLLLKDFSRKKLLQTFLFLSLTQVLLGLYPP
jgi:hypothetical protein